MSRQERIDALIWVLSRKRTPRSKQELCDEVAGKIGTISVTPVSLMRDIEYLRAEGYDICEEQHPDNWRVKRYWLKGSNGVENEFVRITADELLALSVARELLYPLAGTDVWKGIESFWEKIFAIMPEATKGRYESHKNLVKVLGIPWKSYKEKHDILKTVVACIDEHRCVQIVYKSPADKRRKRDIQPLGVLFYNFSIYIVAIDNNTPDNGSPNIKQFKLDRFQKASRLDNWFTPPRGFDLEKYRANDFGVYRGEKKRKYKIRFTGRAAETVAEDPWSVDMTFKQEGKGAVVATLTASHDMAVIPKVLSFGPDAEVLAPADCREKVAEEIAAMAERYGVRTE